MANIAIFGASGGLGNAFVNQFATDPSNIIHAFSRTPAPSTNTNIRPHPIDILDEGSIAQGAAIISQTAQSLDLILIASGQLHHDGIGPEKSLRELRFDKFEQIFRINTFTPALIAKHFIPLLPKNGRSIFAALSARVSSIEDNQLGGWYSYRASKTALNMILKNIAIETSRTKKDAIILGLHPGTVDTNLSKPFQNNVPSHQLFTPEQSVQKLIDVLNKASTSQSGCLLDWKGEVIPA